MGKAGPGFTIKNYGTAGAANWRTISLGRAAVSVNLGSLRQFVRSTLHFFSYYFLFSRRRIRTARAAGFQLTVRPTVFHPKYFLTSEKFANFISKLDLAGKHVADIGTGSGILALAAARSGAATVVALDVNPNAALSASENARQNGFGDRVFAVCCNLMAAIAPKRQFDVLFSNPPYFAGEPCDLTDRAWHAGPNYRDIRPLFSQAHERLKPDGSLYVMMSSASDLAYLSELVSRAHMRWWPVEEFSIMIEKLVIYEARISDDGGAQTT
jgi:release factor glutamine methyltransferase